MRALTFPLRFIGTVIKRYWPIIALIVLWWWWIASTGVTSIVAPSPGAVFGDMVQNLPIYLPPLLLTFGLAIVGLALGVLTGVVIGTLVWMSPLVAGLVTPGALIIRVVPMTALVPIVARIFGFNGSTVLLIVVLLVFFPAFVLTISGLSATPPGTADVFRVLGSNRWTAIRRLHLPSALPSIMLALRISAPFSVGAVLLAQYLTAAGGLGALMRQSHNFSLFQREWGVAILATALSVLIFGLARLAEDRIRRRFT
jgi:NitT/TauT family transport system permease protein